MNKIITQACIGQTRSSQDKTKIAAEKGSIILS